MVQKVRGIRLEEPVFLLVLVFENARTIEDEDEDEKGEDGSSALGPIPHCPIHRVADSDHA
jgi:hypothetical protein